jgi:hypothetical protein
MVRSLCVTSIICNGRLDGRPRQEALQIPLYSAFLFMFSKLFVFRFSMRSGLAKALGLNDEAGRAAVLIASPYLNGIFSRLPATIRLDMPLFRQTSFLITALILASNPDLGYCLDNISSLFT